MIRLHTRPGGGGTRLAAFCDVCGEQITEHGYVVWKGHVESAQPADWMIVHQASCDPGGDYRLSMALDVEIVCLAKSAGVDLDEAVGNAEFFSRLA
jgi:hypothetical protein